MWALSNSISVMSEEINSTNILTGIVVSLHFLQQQNLFSDLLIS